MGGGGDGGGGGRGVRLLIRGYRFSCICMLSMLYCVKEGEKNSLIERADDLLLLLRNALH